jgi:hypothetical protein
VSPEKLVLELAERIGVTRPGEWLRVAFDGAPAAEPDRWADAVVDPLRVLGRPVVRVRAADYLRPASLRLEHGRYDPDVFYGEWLDVAALNREALRPLEPGGSGLVRTAHWDADLDRAARRGPTVLPAGGVLLLSGALLLGQGLAVDLTVHFAVSAAALARRTDPDWAWTLPAYARYADEVDPAAFADVVVRLDDPRHPAVMD